MQPQAEVFETPAPSAPEPLPSPQFAIPAAVLLDGIKRVEHAMASDEARPVLATILLERNADKLRLITANNYQIAWADLNVDADQFVGPVLIARRDVPLIKTWLGYKRGQLVAVHFTPETMSLSAGQGTALTVRLQDGMYPDYIQVIPPKGGLTVALNADYLATMARSMKGYPILSVYVAGPLSAVLFESVDGGEVIMPIKTAPAES